MKTAIKKFILAIWLVIAVLAFAAGLALFITDPSFEGYLAWGGCCAFACIVHLIIDFCCKDIEGNIIQVIIYFALCILLGPLLILLFGKRALNVLRSKPNHRHKQAASSHSENDETNGDHRQRDRSDEQLLVFNNAMEKAVSSAVSRADIPDGRYVAVARKDIDYVVTKTFGIKVYGSITYKIKHIGPARSADEYKRDIQECMERAQKNLFRTIENAVQDVQSRYTNYDNEWNVNLSLKPKIAD